MSSRSVAAISHMLSDHSLRSDSATPLTAHGRISLSCCDLPQRQQQHYPRLQFLRLQHSHLQHPRLLLSHLLPCCWRPGVRGEINELSGSKDGPKTATLKTGEKYEGYDEVLFAIGRKPVTDTLNLEKTG